MDRHTPVSSVLTMAKVAAVKLGIPLVLDWISLESAGYGETEVPTYRRVHGEPSIMNPINGPIPLMSNDTAWLDEISQLKIGQSIAELEGLVTGNYTFLKVPFSPKLQRLTQQHLPLPMPGFFKVSPISIIGILDTVRQKILDWTLELERVGVLGGGLTFSRNERYAAMKVTNNFHNANIGVVGNVDGQATVTTNQTMNAHVITVTEISGLTSQIRSFLVVLPAAVATDIEQPLIALEREASALVPDQSKVRAALSSLKNVCEGTAGNLMASGIASMAASLLGS